jgi:hypothetical protein
VIVRFLAAIVLVLAAEAGAAQITGIQRARGYVCAERQGSADRVSVYPNAVRQLVETEEISCLG